MPTTPHPQPGPPTHASTRTDGHRHARPRRHPAVRAVAWAQSRHPHRTRPAADDRGQATAEYGLVILAAGGIALGVIAWASGTNSFTNLFQSVVRKLTSSL